MVIDLNFDVKVIRYSSGRSKNLDCSVGMGDVDDDDDLDNSTEEAYSGSGSGEGVPLEAPVCSSDLEPQQEGMANEKKFLCAPHASQFRTPLKKKILA